MKKVSKRHGRVLVIETKGMKSGLTSERENIIRKQVRSRVLDYVPSQEPSIQRLNKRLSKV